MTDRHMRILRHIARQAQRKLDRHNTLEPVGDAASADRRDHLEEAASRTHGQVADAEQRRQPSIPAGKARP